MIPIFVSCPSYLNEHQRAFRAWLDARLGAMSLQPRTVGQTPSDTAKDLPLKEVRTLARHCSGAVILGAEQFRTTGAVYKGEELKDREFRFPTAWNHLEAGILFGLRLPLLIIKEKGVQGGIFDLGVTEVFIHEMALRQPNEEMERALNPPFTRWAADVYQNYYYDG